MQSSRRSKKALRARSGSLSLRARAPTTASRCAPVAPTTAAKKHGENVLTGVAGKVKPDYLSPLWSQHERNFIHSRAARQDPRPAAGAAGGAAAVIGGFGAFGGAHA